MEIKLSGEKGVAIVSNEDYELLSKYTWCMTNANYAKMTLKGKGIQMHRFIMDAKKGETVDHINGNRLDNRKENLRIVTVATNAQNKRNVKNNMATSKYKGLYYDKKNKKYCCRIAIKNKTIFLGNYSNEIEAAEVYDMYVVHNNLDHIPINFSDKKEEYIRREYKPIVKKEKQIRYIGVQKKKNRKGDIYTYNVVVSCSKGIRKHICKSIDPIFCAKTYDKYIVDNNILGKTLNFPNDYPEYGQIKTIKTLCKPVDDNTVQLLFKENNNVVIIDKNDYDKIKYYTCLAGKKNIYIRISINGVRQRLHRFLMNITDPEIYVDHVDSNIFNNKKNNLRISDSAKNARNKKKAEGTISKYIGVSKCKNRWISKISYDGKCLHCESSGTEEIAARKRDLYILENLKNEHYKLNFVWTPEDIIKWKDILEKEKLKP